LYARFCVWSGASLSDHHLISHTPHPQSPQGAIIAKGFERVGSNGQVVIEESPTMLDEIDFSEVRWW
jgi:hypothetical protein